MDYRILGPLEISDGDRSLALGGEKQRALLVLLLLHAGEVVSADRLIDDLWAERSPLGAPKALQAHISRLRKALDANGADSQEADGEPAATSPRGVLVTRERGYLLRVEPGELDLDRFQALVDAGRRALAMGDAQQAADTLRVGLALWRGPPLADFAYEPFAQAPIAELEELRLGAVEDRVEADLALGRHERLVGELAAMVKQNPLRERLRMQLMLALYRCGRQAEALDVYQEYRRGLAGELGLDPSPRLQRLENTILERDPSLDLQASGAATAGVARSGSPDLGGNDFPLRRRRRVWLALGATALTALAVVAAAIATTGTDASPTIIAVDSVGAIGPSNGTITADVPLGASPSSAVAGEGAVWVANYNEGTVSRIDPVKRTRVETIPSGATPSGMAVGGGAVWVANTFSGTLSWINPAVNRVVKTIPVGNGPSGVAVGFGSVWVANSSDGTLSRIDANTGAPQQTIQLLGGATDVAAGLGAVWVSDEASGRVLRVDPQTNQPTMPINVGNGPTAITVGFGSVWVANSLDGTVSRIDPDTNSVAHVIGVGQGPSALAAGAGAVWVTNEFGGSVSRIDPVTNDARTIRVGGRPQGVAVTGGLVWLGAQASDISHRGGTLTVMTSNPFDTDDPANVFTLAPAYTLYMTNDGLTAFKRVGGSDGAQLEPDLAVSLPTPTDGGTIYTFQLRPGIRYSNGAPVRPEDFRRAIERGFKLSAFVYQEEYESIVGGAQCVARPAHCNLSRGIVTDDTADTVTFHLVAPDPEFRRRLALVWAVAVPRGTPAHDVGSSLNLPAPLPATGPYEIASYTPHEVKLVRNPYFHEWSHAARPDGYPDQIVWKVGASPSAAVTAVEQNRADYTLDPPPPSRLPEVQTRFAGQLHAFPNDETAALFLNTRVAPFNDIRVRRALNYAVDRQKVAGFIGLEAQPTCQLLPPYVPGYQRYCPYSLNPNPDQIWSARDLDKARSLIAASHTRGLSITIWSQPSFGMDYTSTGRYLVSLLDSLGYEAHLKTFGPNDNSFFDFASPSPKHQAAFTAAVPAFPAASEFIPYFFSCQYIVGAGPSSLGSNISEFCSPRLDATIGRALAAEGTNSPAWPYLWASADRQVTDAAPLVPLVNPSELDFVSARVGNYQYNPVQGPLLDQLWVR